MSILSMSPQLHLPQGWTHNEKPAPTIMLKHSAPPDNWNWSWQSQPWTRLKPFSKTENSLLMVESKLWTIGKQGKAVSQTAHLLWGQCQGCFHTLIVPTFQGFGGLPLNLREQLWGVFSGPPRSLLRQWEIFTRSHWRHSATEAPNRGDYFWRFQLMAVICES